MQAGIKIDIAHKVVIRLYIPEKFVEGETLKLPRKELHYFKKVRRGDELCEVFNREGQFARARLEADGYLRIESMLEKNFLPSPVKLAVGLPEKQVLKKIVLSLSEMGVSELILFGASRSQAWEKRKGGLAKLEDQCIEAARQCGRVDLLKVQALSFEQLLSLDEGAHRVFLDEDPGLKGGVQLAQKPSLVVVGCEGGWTAQERDALNQGGFEPVHLPTATLRVETAVTCAAFLGLMNS